MKPPPSNEIYPVEPKPPLRASYAEPPEGAPQEAESYYNFTVDGAVWSGVQANHVGIREARLRRVQWGESRMERLRLTDVRLEACELTGAQWGEAQWERVALDECRLFYQALPEARLREVRATRCNATLALFRFATLDNVLWDECTLQEADFLGATLRNVRFCNCDLSRADFTRATLANVDVRGCQLDGLRIAPDALRGLVIEPVQALDIARLAGVEIRWE